ncbi:MAG: uracil-DNA glycosylase family protein [Brevinematales bacterium]
MAKIFHRYLEDAFFASQDRRYWILGSFPSVLVKEAFGTIDREYDVDYFYGGKGNRFWPTLARIFFRMGVVDSERLLMGWGKKEAIEERKSLLAAGDLGITDLYMEIESEGKASDRDIVPARWNPYLEEIVLRAEVLFVTSHYVASHLQKAFQNKEGIRQKIVCLPSPSPLSRLTGYTDEKLERRYEEIFSLFLPVFRK